MVIGRVRFNKKCLVFLVFGISVILHTAYAFQMEMLSIDPNEFGVSVWTALFTGKNWSGVMSGIPYYYGYAGAVFYVPFMLFINNPFTQYKAMLIFNGIVVSFVPVIAYRVSLRLGVSQVWQRILVAIVCGLYSTVFAHTKFIWNEISCIIFPWLIISLIIRTGDEKPGLKKHMFSGFTAFICAVSYFAHPRLICVILSATAVILFARVFLKVKLVYQNTFFIVFATAMLGFMALDRYLIGVIWRGGVETLQNTIGFFIGQLTHLKTVVGWEWLFTTVLGHLYYFATSTWGLGIIAVCLAVLVQVKYFTGRRLKTIVTEKPDSKVIGHLGYNNYFLIFSLYALLSNLFAAALSTLSKYSANGYGQYQDTVIFGRYMDSVIPLLIMFVICYVFLYGLDLQKLLAATVVIGIIYGLFFVFAAPAVVNSPETRVSPMLGIYPVRIGERVDAVITSDGLFLTVSCVLCFIAVFIVVVCCAKKYRALILSGIMIAIMLYSSLYTATVYLPFAESDATRANRPIYEVNKYIYNSTDAPPVYVFNLPRRTFTLLQFLNQNTVVTVARNRSDIPEHCFILVKNDDKLALRPRSRKVLEEIGATSEYTVYAYGERAVAYVQSQTGSEILASVYKRGANSSGGYI
ncbi:MAG: hypothetical protein LBR74_10570 [Eubacterium sp.]|jgi:hypothetical protein|nr:hypothetical protein [Eubacterium sp.]